MAAVKLHTEFQREFNLDHAELTFLSAMYYQQLENDNKPVSFTQDHITNLTGVGKYSQRRVRQTLADKKLMRENTSMTVVTDDNGNTRHRKTITYSVNIKKLDALLAEVEYRKAERAADQTGENDTVAQKPEAKTGFKPELAVKMNAEWLPDAVQLESYLTAYDIDPRFATHDVLPEFVAFWSNTEYSCLPVQWQTKFHSLVNMKWESELKRRYRAAKIAAASDKKADAIAAVKEAQATKMIVAAGAVKTQPSHYDFGITHNDLDNQSRYQRRQPTTAELADTSWADRYDFDFEE